MPDPWMPAVEQTIRDLIADNPGLPVRAEFHRGHTGNYGPLDVWTKTESVATPDCPHEWFVLIKPNPFDIVVSVAGRYMFGVHDTFKHQVVTLPQTRPGRVDVEAAAGSRFEVELLGAIRVKAAEIAEQRAAVKA